MPKPIRPVSTRKPTIVDVIGAGAAHGGLFVLRLLPFSWVSALGGGLASTFGPLLKPSKTARENLTLAFPNKGEAEIEYILRQAWDNLGRTAFEFAVMDRLQSDTGKQRVSIEGQANIDAALGSGKPVLFFGAHLGNWELLPVSAAIIGFGVHVFYRAPNNPLLQGLFTKRTNPGELIPKGAPGAKRAFTLLKRGENLGILVDQKLNDGISVPFFGRDVMTGTALAEFALRFDAPMVPIQCIRLPGARFKLIYHPALPVTRTGDKKADVRTIMTDVNRVLESWINEHPGDWLWLHKRWPN